MKKLKLLGVSLVFIISSCSYNVEPFVGNVAKGFADGKGDEALFNNIEGKGAVDNDGNLYIPDYNNKKIRKISLDGSSSTYLYIEKEDKALNPYKQELEPDKIYFDKYQNIYINYNHYGILKIQNNTGNKAFLNGISIPSICGFDNENNFYSYSRTEKTTSKDYSFNKYSENNIVEVLNFQSYIGGSDSNCFGFDKKTNEILYYDFKKGADDIPVWIFDKPAPDIYSKYRLNVKTLEKRPFEIDSMNIEFDSDGNIYYFKDSKVYKALIKDQYKTNTEIASFVGISKLDANLTLDEKRKILYVYGFGDNNQIFKVKI